MGRRSINTTKSGKFMNPTDQARKEARKKELKKNKKQRQMVRAAVLKGKDPHHLIHEMEKIDRMEFDVNNPPQLNEKVLRDKRKKLRETFSRVLKLYEKEDPEQYKDMRRLEFDYESKRTMLMQYYESVKYAQQVQIEDIPLPSMQMPLTAPPPPAGAPAATATSQIPLPSDIPLPVLLQPPHSILKKTSAYDFRPYISAPPWIRPRVPPGVPPGPPPPFSDDESDDEVEQALEEIQKSYGANAEKARRIRFADDNSQIQDVQETDEDSPAAKVAKTIQETENSNKKPEEGMAKPSTAETVNDKESVALSTSTILPPGPPTGLPPGPPPGLPPIMFRPPMMRPGFPPPVRLPPGPPPGRPMGPPGLPPGLPPRMLGPPPVRLPPGPPPGVPPHRMIRPGVSTSQSSSSSSSRTTSNVVSAPPSLINRSKSEDEHKGVATIEGKPQLKNLSADITRFMPTSLRVKREDKGKKRDQKLPSGFESNDIGYSMLRAVSRSVPTKDDAYEQFMKEMEDLM